MKLLWHNATYWSSPDPFPNRRGRHASGRNSEGQDVDREWRALRLWKTQSWSGALSVSLDSLFLNTGQTQEGRYLKDQWCTSTAQWFALEPVCISGVRIPTGIWFEISALRAPVANPSIVSILKVHCWWEDEPVLHGIRSPLKVVQGDQLIDPLDHNMPFEKVLLKLKVDTKHRLLMLTTCNVD